RAGELPIVADPAAGDDARGGRVARSGPDAPAARTELPADEAPRAPWEPRPAPAIPSIPCDVDADCVRLERGCCELGQYVAIHEHGVAGYRAALGCEEPHACPFILVLDDHSVAQCNVDKHACEVVKVEDIGCNAFSTNPHACPSGFHCVLPELVADAPGKCIQQCGGFANLPCDDMNAHCLDDPTDDCDPARGGADCSGLCTPPR
ncbi:MAG: hypothetical protein KF795_27910, partial [Labilithrix sp.]|nr:hypothetical protein [Labilithrix sp.]